MYLRPEVFFAIYFLVLPSGSLWLKSNLQFRLFVLRRNQRHANSFWQTLHFYLRYLFFRQRKQHRAAARQFRVEIFHFEKYVPVLLIFLRRVRPVWRGRSYGMEALANFLWTISARAAVFSFRCLYQSSKYSCQLVSSTTGQISSLNSSRHLPWYFDNK